jgi:predicted RNA-binding Zn-ribbon protein involved in translation (DUF1610 family)
METLQTNQLQLKLKQTVYRKLCPECGEQMVEVDRVTENNLTYVWFECSSDNCNGQWLQSYCSSLQKYLPNG